MRECTESALRSGELRRGPETLYRREFEAEFFVRQGRSIASVYRQMTTRTRADKYIVEALVRTPVVSSHAPVLTVQGFIRVGEPDSLPAQSPITHVGGIAVQA